MRKVALDPLPYSSTLPVPHSAAVSCLRLARTGLPLLHNPLCTHIGALSMCVCGRRLACVHGSLDADVCR